MFPYTENDNESEYAFKITFLNTKHTNNIQIHFKESEKRKFPSPYFSKMLVQNDQRFMLIFMTIFIICKNCVFLYIFAHIKIVRNLTPPPTALGSI